MSILESEFVYFFSDDVSVRWRKPNGNCKERSMCFVTITLTLLTHAFHSKTLTEKLAPVNSPGHPVTWWNVVYSSSSIHLR